MLDEDLCSNFGDVVAGPKHEVVLLARGVIGVV